jgi:hypothetical protein
MPAKTSPKSSKKKRAAPRALPCTVICRFTVKPDKEKEFVKALSRDWPGLLRLGLATKDEPVVYRHEDESGGPVYFQVFHWVSADAVASAHHHPEVMASWGTMDPLCEARCGHGKWEFPHVEQVSMNWVGLRGLAGATGRA